MFKSTAKKLNLSKCHNLFNKFFKAISKFPYLKVNPFFNNLSQLTFWSKRNNSDIPLGKHLIIFTGIDGNKIFFSNRKANFFMKNLLVTGFGETKLNFPVRFLSAM